MQNYSDRIRKIVDLLHPCEVLADIGCDHGYVSSLSLTQEKAQKVIAADIHQGPLSRAKQTAEKEGLTEYMEFCLSDGFDRIDIPFNAAVICGMGGLLIRDILSRAFEKISGASQLILGPHSETAELRAFLTENPLFTIQKECVLFDQGKYYVLMDVAVLSDGSREILPEEDLLYGKTEIQTDSSQYLSYLSFLTDKTEKALKAASKGDSGHSAERAESLRHQLSLLKKKTENHN